MELFTKLLELSFWEKFADFHGLLAMVSLVLFGAAIILYFAILKGPSLIAWLQKVLLVLFINLTLLDIAGLTVYIPYRAEGGPRTILKASESTSWMHGIVFEHKEFLAFAPPIMILTAYFVVKILCNKFNDKQFSSVRKSVIFSIVTALVFVLIVAAEAVLVTKTAPVQ